MKKLLFRTFSIFSTLVTFFAIGQTTTFYDFNTAGQLSTYFNGTGETSQVSQGTNTGIGGTGSVSLTQPANAIFTTKEGYSLGPVGSVYNFESYIQSVGNNGYSGMGFTANTPATASSSFVVYRPEDALGISVHGGGFVFHNGATDYSGSWSQASAGSITAVKTATISDLLNSGSPDKWYKVIFVVRKATATTFNMRVEVWSSYTSGTLIRPSAADAIFEVNGITNNTIMNAPAIYSYFNFSGDRARAFDNYGINLSGGATVVQQGAPVVLTTSATNNSGIITVNGNVTSDNGSAITERGFVYGTTTAPTTSNNKVTASGTTGTFTASTPTALANGTYYVRAFAKNNIGTSYGAESMVTVGTLSTEDITSKKIAVSPNPAKDFAIINNIKKGANISVFDLNGKLVFSTKSQNNSLSIDTSSFVNGVYLIKIDKETIKLIVSK